MSDLRALLEHILMPTPLTALTALVPVAETAPPGKKAAKFLKKHKAEFRKRYGKGYKSYLYGTAWTMFG